MLEFPTTVTAFVLGCIVLILYAPRRISHSLPPGPRGLPWIGNVIGVDADAPWTTYAEWARKYGDLVHSRLFGKDIIIINSEKIARDLLEKRSYNYSDRPSFVTIELSGVGFNTVFLPYGNRWRLHRRFFHQTFRREVASRFVPTQHRKTFHFLQQLLDNPNTLDEHVFEYTASIVLNSVYDYDPSSRNDQLIEMAANVLDVVVPALRPEVAITIGAFPFLLHLPSWFPGMSFKRNLAMARELSKHYLERPFEHALRKVSSESATPSMVHDALHGQDGGRISTDKPWMQALKDAAGTAFLGASDTSNSVLMTFFLMMMMHPEVQERAQAQIDEVLGRSRLPTISDRPALPLIDAILRETLRYNPAIPLSVPHTTVNDDVYDGFYIPKGALLFANLWSMVHDESKYSDPHTFIPERFINDDGSLKPDDTSHIVFGFGRRICVGRHFADTSLWSVIANVLAVFRILKPLDENGVEITVEPKFTSGPIIHALPFQHRIVPRFQEMDANKLEQLIAASG